MLFLDSVTMKETQTDRNGYPFSVPALRHLASGLQDADHLVRRQ